MTRRTLLAAGASLARAASARPYLDAVHTFARTLLECGTDRYGPKRTPAWAGVIDTETWSAPRNAKEVPPPPGIRESDRAVGGANLYHDAVTLRVFLALTEVTGDARYAQAARDYMKWFLSACRSPQNGLLAWGEHLYYDLYRDEVAIERKSHELLEWTPPWDLLWEVNREAAAGAIAGLRYHHYEDRPGSLFNRHAVFDRAEFQRPGGQPWIKHSGLYACSFAFLYAKTGETKWLEWARGEAGLYWDRRNPVTGLTLSCIDDPRPGSKQSTIGTTLLAYWLRKAGAAAPAEPMFRERALALVRAWDKAAGRNPEGYLAGMRLDGTPASKETIPPWHFAYGESALLPYGRIAAYFHWMDKDERMLAAARRVHRIARSENVPANASLEAIGFALNLALDLYDLTAEREYLEDARRYAGMARERFWRGDGKRGLFVRLAGDRYYEAKTAAGDVLAGLLRLDAALNGRKLKGDWTF